MMADHTRFGIRRNINRLSCALVAVALLVHPLLAEQENLVAQARSALKAGEKEAAVRLAQQATRADSKSVDAWMVLGEAQLSLIATSSRESRARSAIRAFNRVIRLNPSHSDIYLLRGIAYLEGLQDSVKAGADFERQLQSDPKHPEASVRLLQLAVDMGEWELAESLAASVLVNSKNDLRVYRSLLRLYILKKEWGPGALVARRYLSILSPLEREVVEDLTPLLNSAEMEYYRGLETDTRALYGKQYWARRGGADLDDFATRYIEHIWRVAEARAQFSGAEHPWDIRGELFVRYGPPDFRITSISGLSLNMILDGDFQSNWRRRMLELGISMGGVDSGNPTTFFNTDFDPPRGMGRYEFWVYKSEGLLFLFRALSIGGTMQLTEDHANLNQALKNRMPMISRLEESTIPLEPSLQIAQFRGEGGKTRVHAYFALPVTELVAATLDSLPSEEIITQVALTDRNNRVIADIERRRILIAGPATQLQRSKRFVEAISFNARADVYSLSAFMAHRRTQRYGAVGPNLVELRDFTGNELTMSDLVLASTDSLGLHEKNLHDEGLTYIPHPKGVFDLERPFTIYFEVHNLSRDMEGVSTYDVTYEVFPEPGSRTAPSRIYSSVAGLLGVSRGEPIVSLTSTYRSLRSDVVHRPDLIMQDHSEGLYRLRVTVRDTQKGTVVSRETTFLVLYAVPPR